MSPEVKPGSAIILAAGFSRRFGKDKRILRFGNSTLLARTCTLYTEVFNRVFVVLRPDDSALAESLPPSVEIILSPRAEEGMSRSLEAGIQAASDSPWVVVGLGDMPYVSRSTLQLLRNELETNTGRVVRLKHSDRFGNPVGFPAEYYDCLLRLSGDRGALSLIKSGRLKRTTLTVEDEGIFMDIDSPDDIRH